MKLKKCPKCNIKPKKGYASGFWYYDCKCGLIGAGCPTEKDAIIEWNDCVSANEPE